MRDPSSAAFLRRDDARLHPLHSAAAQRVGALLLEAGGDDAPTTDASTVATARRALATLACCGFFLLIARTDFHAAGATGYLATPTVGASGSREVPTEDPRMRLNSKFGAMAGAVALSVGGQAVAQNAVQWRVADGGNGHWYRLSMKPLSFEAARQQSAALGGHLVTYSSSAEQNHVWQQVSPVVSPQPFFIGAYQVPNSCEPGCGWRWVTDEPFSYTAWLPGAPNDNLVNGNEDAVCINADNRWNDLAGQLPIPYVTEWDADCNNDGLIDYGQILAGELADANHNNIPDCCESGAGCAIRPIQWRAADGGNDHWYAGYRNASGSTWTAARGLANALGGSLVSCETNIERQFVIANYGHTTSPSLWEVQSINSDAKMGPWIGAYQDQGSREPNGGWHWLSGSPLNPQDAPNCCGNDCSGVQEDRLHLYAQVSTGWTVGWNDLTDDPTPCSHLLVGAIVEFSADCNNDGLVDYGQILAGELADANLNNIPDCCEQGAPCGCPADIARDGVVNGIDLAAVLNNWGTTGGAINADVNHDGVVNGSDLAIVLNSWGPCP